MMTCEEAMAAILTEANAAEPDGALAEHRRGCPNCQAAYDAVAALRQMGVAARRTDLSDAARWRTRQEAARLLAERRQRAALEVRERMAWRRAGVWPRWAAAAAALVAAATALVWPRLAREAEERAARLAWAAGADEHIERTRRGLAAGIGEFARRYAEESDLAPDSRWGDLERRIRHRTWEIETELGGLARGASAPAADPAIGGTGRTEI
jgi:hypothetical protein